LIYDVGFIEKYGSGIYMMRNLCKKWGNKEPYYRLHPVETKIIFESKIKEPTFIEIEKDILERLNKRQIKAIDYLKHKGRITTEEYVKLVKISLRTAKRDLLDLKDKRIIQFVGPPKIGYYCLNGTVNGTVKRRSK